MLKKYILECALVYPAALFLGWCFLSYDTTSEIWAVLEKNWGKCYKTYPEVGLWQESFMQQEEGRSWHVSSLAGNSQLLGSKWTHSSGTSMQSPASHLLLGSKAKCPLSWDSKLIKSWRGHSESTDVAFCTCFPVKNRKYKPWRCLQWYFPWCCFSVSHSPCWYDNWFTFLRVHSSAR